MKNNQITDSVRLELTTFPLRPDVTRSRIDFMTEHHRRSNRREIIV